MAWKPKSLFNVQTGSTPTVQSSSKHSIKIPGEAEGQHDDDPTVGVKQIIPGALNRALGVSPQGVNTIRYTQTDTLTVFPNNVGTDITIVTDPQAVLGIVPVGSVLVYNFSGAMPNPGAGLIHATVGDALFPLGPPGGEVPVGNFLDGFFNLTLIQYVTQEIIFNSNISVGAQIGARLTQTTGVAQDGLVLTTTVINILK